MNPELAALADNLSAIYERLFARLPLREYGSAAALIVIGMVVGKLVYVIIVALLELIRFDRLVEKTGFIAIFGDRARNTPARLVGRVFYWLILAVFLLVAIDTLQITSVELLLEGMVGIVGKVLSFAILLVLADIIARFIAGVFDTALKLVDHGFAGQSAGPVRIMIVVGVGIMGLEILSVDVGTKGGMMLAIIVAVFAVVMGATWLNLRMKNAFVARRLSRRVRVGDHVTLNEGIRGVVTRVGTDYVVLSGEDETHIVPAAWILESPLKKEAL